LCAPSKHGRRRRMTVSCAASTSPHDQSWSGDKPQSAELSRAHSVRLPSVGRESLTVRRQEGLSPAVRRTGRAQCRAVRLLRSGITSGTRPFLRRQTPGCHRKKYRLDARQDHQEEEQQHRDHQRDHGHRPRVHGHILRLVRCRRTSSPSGRPSSITGGVCLLRRLGAARRRAPSRESPVAPPARRHRGADARPGAACVR
jgi:hypothetical protein